jgi:hypothetical protein
MVLRWPRCDSVTLQLHLRDGMTAYPYECKVGYIKLCTSFRCPSWNGDREGFAGRATGEVRDIWTEVENVSHYIGRGEASRRGARLQTNHY